jgi:hypothetical protein
MAKEARFSRGFPTFATVLLVVGIIWLLNDLKIIAVNIPWIPAILIIVAIGMIANRWGKGCC